MYIYVYAYMCVYVCACLCLCLCLCVCVSVSVSVYVYAYGCMYIDAKYISYKMKFCLTGYYRFISCENVAIYTFRMRTPEHTYRQTYALTYMHPESQTQKRTQIHNLIPICRQNLAHGQHTPGIKYINHYTMS